MMISIVHMQPGSRKTIDYWQRGTLGELPEDAIPSLAELAQQGEQLAARVQRLQTGLSNLIQLQQAQESDIANMPDRQAAAEELQRLQQAVDEFELELLKPIMAWQHVKETFWLAIRFGGLGLVLGWLLAWLVQRG